MARRGSSKRTESGITRRILSQAYNPTDILKQIHKKCKHMAESGITRRGYASVYIILNQAYNPTDTSKQIHKTCKHMAESGITRRGYASVRHNPTDTLKQIHKKTHGPQRDGICFLFSQKWASSSRRYASANVPMNSMEVSLPSQKSLCPKLLRPTHFGPNCHFSMSKG
jgi:hypothetical protein